MFWRGMVEVQTIQESNKSPASTAGALLWLPNTMCLPGKCQNTMVLIAQQAEVSCHTLHLRRKHNFVLVSQVPTQQCCTSAAHHWHMQVNVQHILNIPEVTDMLYLFRQEALAWTGKGVVNLNGAEIEVDRVSRRDEKVPCQRSRQ